MKLHAIRLLQTAMISGKPRSPAEGIQMVSKADRDRLVKEVGHAVDAEDDVEQHDEGDDLGGKTVPALRKVASAEGAVVESDANKAAILSAIRDRRALFVDSGIEPASDDDLRKIVNDEGLTAAEGADTAALINTIKEGKAAKA